MKALILSDLHLEFGAFEPPAVDADVVVLAGDIGAGAEGIRWARNAFPSQPIIYVQGNHELYGNEFYEVIDACRREAEKAEVTFLENEAAIVDGVRFLGATLWSDYCLHGGGTQPTSMRAAASSINDFRRINIIGANGVKRAFQPADACPSSE